MQTPNPSLSHIPLPGVPLRPAHQVMTLERMGSFHQSRLSFMRVLLRNLKTQAWRFERPIWRINSSGVGVATYSAIGPKRTYTLVAFAHDLPPNLRSDRVIAEAWDATFTLFDGVPDESDIERLSHNVPLQEAGRISDSEFILSRANRSVRLFDYVIEQLSKGQQPDAKIIGEVGYLMRTTAVYGSGKFGAADRSIWAQREEFNGSFQPELLGVWLIRSFTLDLVEHLAAAKAPTTATCIKPELRRQFGVGNSTGLGMAPFLLTHPSLVHTWINARETALARVRSLPDAIPEVQNLFRNLVTQSQLNSHLWKVDHPLQAAKICLLRNDFEALQQYLTMGVLDGQKPWDQLYLWSQENLSLEGQEQLVSLIIEPYGTLVDDLAATMSANEELWFHIDGKMSVSQLIKKLTRTYAWALGVDFTKLEEIAQIWYVSEEKLEPRIGLRQQEDLDSYEQPLAPMRDAMVLLAALNKTNGNSTLAVFLTDNPEYRHSVRRVQLVAQLPYAEVCSNTISADMLPINLLRCKLAFFGATKFDPRSDRWVRITMFQGAPFPQELLHLDPDKLIYTHGVQQ